MIRKDQAYFYAHHRTEGCFYTIGQYKEWEFGEIAGPYRNDMPDKNYLLYEVLLWERISLKTFNSLVSGSTCKYEDNSMYVRKTVIYNITSPF